MSARLLGSGERAGDCRTQAQRADGAGARRGAWPGRRLRCVKRGRKAPACAVQADTEREPGHSQYLGCRRRGEPVPGNEPKRLAVVLAQPGQCRQDGSPLRHLLAEVTGAGLPGGCHFEPQAERLAPGAGREPWPAITFLATPNSQGAGSLGTSGRRRQAIRNVSAVTSLALSGSRRASA